MVPLTRVTMVSANYLRRSRHKVHAWSSPYSIVSLFSAHYALCEPLHSQLRMSICLADHARGMSITEYQLLLTFLAVHKSCGTNRLLCASQCTSHKETDTYTCLRRLIWSCLNGQRRLF
jgi:hypothetical protein